MLFIDEIDEPSFVHVADVAIDQWGPEVRHNDRFQPDGANANFVELRRGNTGIFLRTFERGVEAETGACGTGSVASAIIAAMVRGVVPPVSVTTSSDAELVVSFNIDGDNVHDVTLEGSADVVRTGVLEL
jgi:diaminopimelate epimerase